MLARLRLAQIELRAPRDDDLTVVDVMGQELLQRERARLSVHQSEHIGAERRLHGGVLEELIEHTNVPCVAPQIHDHANALAVRLVAHVGDAVNLLFARQLADLADEVGLVDLIGQLGDDNRVLAALGLLDMRLARTMCAASAV